MRLQLKLQETLGLPLSVDTSAQDAYFFADLVASIPALASESDQEPWRLLLRFSNFDDLVAAGMSKRSQEVAVPLRRRTKIARRSTNLIRVDLTEGAFTENVESMRSTHLPEFK